MSNERYDDELLSAIIDGEADEASVASVLADDAASKRLEAMRTAAGIVAEDPPPATAQRRQQSIAAALAAAESAPEVTSLTAERAARRTGPSPKIIAIAAAVLLFVLAIPVIVGLRPSSDNVASEAADAAADTGLAAGDVVEDVVDGDDEEEAMEDVAEEAEEEAMEDEEEAEEEAMEDDEETSETTAPALSDDAGDEAAADDAEESFVPPDRSLAERLATDPAAVPSTNSITGIDDLVQLGSIIPIYSIDDLVEAGVNPGCVSGASDVDRFGVVLLDDGTGPERLVIVEFTNSGTTILLDAEDCAVLR